MILPLAGSDKQAYEETVMDFVGTWESTREYVCQIYGWRRKELESEEQWRRYAASWPLLQQHLRNTTYLLTVAVWNEDDIGANYYCDLLLRWFDCLQHELQEDYRLIRDLVTPDLMGEDWTAVQASLKPMLHDPTWHQPQPSGGFGVILRNALNDAILIVAGVMLGWFMERRQETDITPLMVSRLLRDAVEDVDTFHEKRDVGFRPLMLNLLRIYAAGERYEQKGYGHWLDDLVLQPILVDFKRGIGFPVGVRPDPESDHAAAPIHCPSDG